METEVNASHPRTRREGWKKILKIAWPLVVANSFWNLQLTIDRIFLGQYSTDALGAAVAVMGVFWVPMALIQQTAGYSMTFVAQYFGAKRMTMIGPAVWQAIYLGIAGGLLFMLLIPAAAPFFAWIGHSENMQPLEARYFASLCYSALPTAIVAAISGFFSGLGNSKVVMWINGVGLVANVILDYFMIFGNYGVPAMGIAGAGYATTLATWLSAFYGFYMLMKSDKNREFAFHAGWRPHADLLKRYIKYSVPAGIQWSVEGLAFTVFLIIVGRMPNGDATLSATGIGVTLMMLAVLPTFGVAQAGAILVGQHLGEKNPELAVQDTWSAYQVATMYICSVGITFLLFPEFYMSWFKNEENLTLWSQVSEIVPYLLMFAAAFTFFDSMNLVFSFAIKGAGDTRFVTLIALTLPWPIMVLPTWFVSNQPDGIYWAWFAALVFGMTQSTIFWRRFVGGKWKKMSVIN